MAGWSKRAVYWQGHPDKARAMESLRKFRSFGLVVALLAGAFSALPTIQVAADQPVTATKVAPAALDAVVGRYDYGGAVLTVTREGEQASRSSPASRSSRSFRSPRRNSSGRWWKRTSRS